MKICVIGADGLIGKSLIKCISVLPDIEVTAFDRNPAPVGISVRWIQGDLQNPEDCIRLVYGQDVIFHLAHTNSPLTSDRDVEQDTLINLVPTLRLLKAIETVGGIPHFIYPSSGGAIYGVSASGNRFKETDPCQPLNSYGIQKLAAEHYIRLGARRGTLTATVLRIGNAYGWLLPPAVTRVLTGQPIRIIGNPENVRDYIHIDDVMAAFLLVMKRRIGFEIFNIGTGIGTTVKKIIEIIERTIFKEVTKKVENLESANTLPNWCILDTQKARVDINWQSKIDIEEGIRRLIEQGKREFKNRT
jgi:UDP-glucose 4-epimerase